MPISKREVLKHAENSLSETMLRGIDMLLLARASDLQSNWPRIILKDSDLLPLGIKNLSNMSRSIIDTYEKQGWEIVFRSDQRDGSWLEFK